jgi:hypothetical protein
MDISNPVIETHDYEPPSLIHFNEVKVGDRIADDIVSFSGRLTPSGRWEIETRQGLLLRGVETSVIWCEKKIWYAKNW